MSIRFACHHCGQRLSVNDEKVGKKAKCPKCKGSLTVPTAAAAAAQLAEIRAERAGAEVEDALSEFVVYDDDTELIYSTEAEYYPAVETDVNAAYVAVPRWAIYVQGILLGIVALVAFTLGIMVGAVSVPDAVEPQAEGPVVLTGHVTFVNSANQPIPDEGSVVIAVPTTVRPDQKIEINGLRPDEELPADDHPGVRILHELGGGLTRVDMDGNYRLQLAGPNRYFVLMLSRHARPQEGTTPDREHLAEMGRYFSDSYQLVDPEKYKYLWATLRIRGDTPLDHDFGRSRE